MMTSVSQLSIIALLAIALTACNDSDSSKTPSSLVDDANDAGDFDDLKPYNSNGPYAQVLARCVTATNSNDYCSLNTLPLLGQDSDAPSIDDIMNRVVISHDWMADNFRLVLGNLPQDILPLFRGLTAIVIDDDIRPAFYTTSTGAIYLDPAYLWTSLDHKQTINPKDDYRSGFDDELAFRALGFYTSGNSYALNYGSLSDNSTRELSDAEPILARLLFHELAHVNDFIPPDSYVGLDTTLTVGQTASALASQRPSNRLDSDYPLHSQLLYDLAEVMYFGETASETLQAVTGDEAGSEFEMDGAADHYAYSNQFEDAAMLFETTLMKQIYGFDYDVSFTDVPLTDSGCAGLIVRWGEFNRLGDSEVKARAQYIVGELLPNLDTNLFFQDLAVPQPMTEGISWCSNLNSKLSNAPSGQQVQKTTVPTNQEIPERFWRRPYL